MPEIAHSFPLPRISTIPTISRSAVVGRVGPGRLPRLSDRARHRWRNRFWPLRHPHTPCTQRFSRTRPAREFRGGLTGPTRSATQARRKTNHTQSLDPRLRGDDTSVIPKRSRTAFHAHASAQYRQYHAVPWWGGLVRAGCLDCLTEPDIVGGIVAGRAATLVRPARNDSAVRGPRGSFEAA
jgi:hypothetical protein